MPESGAGCAEALQQSLVGEPFTGLRRERDLTSLGAMLLQGGWVLPTVMSAQVTFTS